MDSVAIGKILFDLRKKKGKTISEVSNDLGISTSALSMYESGSRIPRDEIKVRIAAYYRKSVGSIFYANPAHKS